MTTNDITLPDSKGTTLDLLKTWQWLEWQLVSNGGELTPELEKFYVELQTNLVKKIDALDYLMERMEGQANLLKQKAQEYLAASKTLTNNADRLHEMLKQGMIANGIAELQGHAVRYRISNAKPRLDINGEVPTQYKRIVSVEEIQKDLIRADLEQGKELPFAELKESKSLRRYVGVKL